jgi:hypothetical protein
MNKEDMKDMIDRFTMRVAWLLPKRLISWCFVRVVAAATQGKYSDTVVTELPAMEALQRWDTK